MRAPDLVFYDGACGLCHRTVRFLIARDAEGRLFRFAPIGGETFLARIGLEERAGLPDSVVVCAPDGRVLVRTEAMVHLLGPLGGWPSVVGRLLGQLPRGAVDAAYDWISRNRRRLFALPAAACPVTPVTLRARFDP